MFGLSPSGLLCKQVNSTPPSNNLCEESDYRSFILAAAGLTTLWIHLWEHDMLRHVI